MIIKKTTQTTPTGASVVNTLNNSNTDTYSCAYINGIIESGSDASGNNYTKFIDGTMICRGGGEVVFSNQSYASFETTYPVEFVDYPVVALTSMGGDPTYAFKFTVNYNKTKVSGIAKSDTTITASRPYSYIAIGKWK